MGGETREQNGEGMAKMAGYIMPGTIPVVYSHALGGELHMGRGSGVKGVMVQ